MNNNRQNSKYLCIYVQHTGDLSFFDELEALDEQQVATEQAAAILKLRQRELEDQLQSKNKLNASSTARVVTTTTTTTTSSTSDGWKKGFLGKKLSPLVAQAQPPSPMVAEVLSSSVASLSVSPPAAGTSLSSAASTVTTKTPTVTKSRAVKDIVMERFP